MSKATYVGINDGLGNIEARKVKNVWIKENGVLKQRVIPKGLVGGTVREFISYYKNFYALSENGIYSLNETGSELLFTNTGRLKETSTICVSNDFIFTSEYDSSGIGYLSKFDKKFNLVKRIVPTIGIKRMSITSDNYLICIGTESYQGVVKYDIELNEVWKYSSALVNMACFNGTAISRVGAVYASDDYKLIRVTSSGSFSKLRDGAAKGLCVNKYGYLYFIEGNYIYRLVGTAYTSQNTGSNAISNGVCYGDYVYYMRSNKLYKYNYSLSLIFEKIMGFGLDSNVNYEHISACDDGLYMYRYSEKKFTKVNFDGDIVFSIQPNNTNYLVKFEIENGELNNLG